MSEAIELEELLLLSSINNYVLFLLGFILKTCSSILARPCFFALMYGDSCVTLVLPGDTVLTGPPLNLNSEAV